MPTMQTLITQTTNLNYYVLLPESKTVRDMAGKPLVLSLHGAGTYGYDPSAVLDNGASKAMKKFGLDCILLLPHTERIPWSQRTRELKELIDYVADEYKADKNRISVIGGSMGGYGTWDMILNYPRLFSAACIMCGGGKAFRAVSEPVRIPLTIYHGDSDNAVQPYHAKEMYDAVKAGNPNADVKLIVCENTAHNCWDRAQLEDNVIAWLISKTRKQFDVYACGSEDGAGIRHYVLADGRLKELDRAEDMGAMFLAFKHGKLYAIERTAKASRDGIVTAYDLLTDGGIGRRTGMKPTFGKATCHLAVSDTHEIYIANYLDGSVVRTSLERDDVRMVTHFGDGVNKPRQDKAHTHQVVFTPDGKYLTVCDLGTDTIHVYDKELVEISRVGAPAGHGPRHLLFSDDGAYAYCCNELLNTVTSYAYADGVLTRLETYDMLPFGFEGFTKAAAIKKFGDDLYATNRGHDSITRFRMRGAVLEYVDNVPSEGFSPRDIEISPDGRTLIAANEGGCLAVFDRNEDGSLTFTGQKLDLPGALCAICV